MCGIAGFSLAPDHSFDPEALAEVLLAGIAERGRDATGYAYRTRRGDVVVRKDPRPVTAMIAELDIPVDATEVILHVREHTKGAPAVNDNNHPVRWGRVVGVHNGHLDNDDALFEQFQAPRSTPLISVDSEAIMMLTDRLGCVGEALQHVHGSAAVALLDERHPDWLILARRTRRPLVLGRFPGALFFASTRTALEPVGVGLGRGLAYEDVGDGTVVVARRGRETQRRRFAVDYRYPGSKLTAYPTLAAKDDLLGAALDRLRQATRRSTDPAGTPRSGPRPALVPGPASAGAA
jgi:glutamine phosphoribosylpyrophosphate amidotransferase